jgi:hypothetical protein
VSSTAGSTTSRRRRKARGALKQLVNRARVHGAIPEMSRRAATQALWLHALDNTEPYALLRADATKNARAVAWALARYTDWDTMVARPGWDLLIKLAKLARSTVARYLALFAEWGLLGRVSPGSTWRTRGGRADDEDGNLAGEYVLCVPGREPVDETRTPSLLRKEERSTACEISSRTRTRESDLATWPIHRTPKTRGEQRQAADRLRQQIPLLGRLRSKRLTNLLEPWFELGWNPAQIRYALDHQLDGTPHWHTNDVRHVASWVKHRLGLWRETTPARQLGAGRSTDLTAGDVAQLPSAGERSTADAHNHASRIRQALAATFERRSDKRSPARPGLGVTVADGHGRLSCVTERPTVTSCDEGGDWLLRNAARRAEWDPMQAMAGRQMPPRIA